MASFDEVIPPGQAGTIKASVHTSNFKGAIGKSITVAHDDKAQGPINLTLNAKIVGSVEVFPYPGFQIMRPPRGFETPAQVLLRKDQTEQGDLKFSGLAASAPWLKASSRKVTAEEPAAGSLPAAKPGDVVLSVQAIGAPIGTFVEKVTFKTGLPREPEFTIPVTVMVLPPVNLQPAILVLNPTPDAPTVANGNILASVREDLDPKGVIVTTDTPGFKVHVDPPGDRAFRVIVDWVGKPNKGKPGATETTVHFKVGKETVDLPVRVNVAAAKPS